MSVNLLSQLVCYTPGHNTGRPACDKEPGMFTGGILIPRGYKFSRANTATTTAFKTALQALATADSIAGRILPIPGVMETDNTGEGRVVQTFKNGTKRTVRAARIGWSFLIAAGMFYHAVLSRLNGSHAQYDLLLVDENDVVWGTAKSDAGNLQVLGGYALNDIFTDTFQSDDGTTGGQFKWNVELANASEYDKYFAYVACDFSVFTEVLGIQDVKIQCVAGATTPKVKVYLSANGVDLKPVYNTEFSQVGAYKVTNAEPTDSHYGNVVTVSSVAAITDGWELTLDNTDPDYPGTGKKAQVTFPALSVLAALTTPITGLEGDTFIVTLT